MITVEEYLGQHGKGHEDELTAEMRKDAERVVEIANELLRRSELTHLGLRSGWRPASYNATVPTAAKKSKHILCQAIDIEDDEGELDSWLTEFPWHLDELDIYMEHPASTKGWCHIQIIPPRSKRRVFYP